MSLDENRSSGNPDDDPASNIEPLPSPVADLRLWWCDLVVTRQRLQACERILSAAEHARSARFGNAELRNRYVIGRGSLRRILGGSLALDPAAVDIVRGRRGRPELADRSIDFNISHTSTVALVGTLRTGRIGVDVERLDRVINAPGIARKFLTENERAALNHLDAEAARQRVLTLWTCKEAMSKATGDALSAPFASIDIDVRAGRSLRGGPLPYRPSQWSLHAANVPPEYVATIAVWRREEFD